MTCMFLVHVHTRECHIHHVHVTEIFIINSQYDLKKYHVARIELKRVHVHVPYMK